VEGRNIIVEYRYAEGRQDLATELAAEFVRLKVALIVATTTSGILAIKKASGTIPT
jgi:putative tryptophan/tyrosine transport system substrate-binding protein